MIAGLFNIADEHWPTITARYYQIDLLELPLNKFLDLIFGWCREVIGEPTEWEKFLMNLEAPLPGMAKEISETSAEVEGEAFMAVMKMAGST